MVGRTQAILNKLIQQVVETGFLTAATASAQLIFFIRLNHSYTYGGVSVNSLFFTDFVLTILTFPHRALMLTKL